MDCRAGLLSGTGRGRRTPGHATLGPPRSRHVPRAASSRMWSGSANGRLRGHGRLPIRRRMRECSGRQIGFDGGRQCHRSLGGRRYHAPALQPCQVLQVDVLDDPHDVTGYRHHTEAAQFGDRCRGRRLEIRGTGSRQKGPEFGGHRFRAHDHQVGEPMCGTGDQRQAAAKLGSGPARDEHERHARPSCGGSTARVPDSGGHVVRRDGRRHELGMVVVNGVGSKAVGATSGGGTSIRTSGRVVVIRPPTGDAKRTPRR